MRLTLEHKILIGAGVVGVVGVIVLVMSRRAASSAPDVTPSAPSPAPQLPAAPSAPAYVPPGAPEPSTIDPIIFEEGLYEDEHGISGGYT